MEKADSLQQAHSHGGAQRLHSSPRNLPGSLLNLLFLGSAYLGSREKTVSLCMGLPASQQLALLWLQASLGGLPTTQFKSPTRPGLAELGGKKLGTLLGLAGLILKGGLAA